MDLLDVTGAEATMRYFLLLYPYAYATGDLTEWTEVSHPECVFCTSVIENVRQQIETGYTSTGGSIDVQSVAVDFVGDGVAGFEVSAVQAESTVQDGSGTVVRTNPAQALTLMIALEGGADDGGWSVRAVDITVEEPA